MVKLITENEQNKEDITEAEKTVQLVCEAVLVEENCSFDAEISLTFTDNEQIRAINREYRGIDKATDVLSFPMLEAENGQITEDIFLEDDGAVMLGDIVISLERAREQAKEYGHSFKREVAFLTAHSMLHLLGYDHVDDPEGEEIMCKKQEQILTGLNITREKGDFYEEEQGV